MSSSAASLGRRIACVDVPALPLQLVLRTHPEWAAEPVIVAADDRPQARILWANRKAREARIRRGQRCQEAEALTARLHTAVVSPAELAHANGELLRIVFGFSPKVEPTPDEPGLFFVDANGLHELFTGLEAWAHGLHAALAARGFVAGIAVGFSRFFSYAIARARTGCTVLASPEAERDLAAAVPFHALDASPKLREQMATLGIKTLGGFLALPPAGLARRFGQEAKVLHGRANAPWSPLLATVPPEPVRFTVDFELATSDLDRLLAELEAGLATAFAHVAARREAVTALHLDLVLERAPRRRERLATAAPTLDRAQVLELVRLRLAAAQLAGPVERFTAELESVVVTARQLSLLAVTPRRDLAAGERALARLVASFGERAVTRAKLVPSHVPERSFVWEPLRRLQPPRGRDGAPDGLVAAAAVAESPAITNAWRGGSTASSLARGTELSAGPDARQSSSTHEDQRPGEPERSARADARPTSEPTAQEPQASSTNTSSSSNAWRTPGVSNLRGEVPVPPATASSSAGSPFAESSSTNLPAAPPPAVSPRALVRTLLPVPAPLGSLPLHEPEAWLGEFGAVRRAHGPFRVANGWWQQRIERDYFFLETDRGAVLWVFHDRVARRWYLHGRVD